MATQELSIEELTSKIRAQLEAENKAKAELEAQAALKAENDALKAQIAQANRLPGGKQAPAVLEFDTLYDDMDVADHALMIELLEQNARKNGGKRASEAALKSYIGKAQAEAGKDPAAKMAARAMKAAGIKSDEVNHSDLSSYGDDWVGIAYSTALWESIRVGTFVVNKLPSVVVPNGMESMYLPIESTDPVFYKVAETADVNATTLFPNASVTNSRMGTGKVQLTLSKLGGRSSWSGEMEERSLIPWISQLRQQLQTSGAEYLESAIIDGDTATTYTTNINDIANSTDMTSTEYCLVWNGFRKSPLVTTTANSRSAGGALDIQDYLKTVKLMGGAGINALDRTKVGFIIDPSTNYATLALPEVMTRDVYSRATVEGGMVTDVWGYPVYTSGNICRYSTVRLSNTAGKVDTDTVANNAYGSILAVRWDQWRFGWQRRATIEVTRYPRSDSSEIVMLMTCGLIQRDTEASAITYYVGV